MTLGFTPHNYRCNYLFILLKETPHPHPHPRPILQRITKFCLPILKIVMSYFHLTIKRGRDKSTWLYPRAKPCFLRPRHSLMTEANQAKYQTTSDHTPGGSLRLTIKENRWSLPLGKSIYDCRSREIRKLGNSQFPILVTVSFSIAKQQRAGCGV